MISQTWEIRSYIYVITVEPAHTKSTQSDGKGYYGNYCSMVTSGKLYTAQEDGGEQ